VLVKCDARGQFATSLDDLDFFLGAWPPANQPDEVLQRDSGKISVSNLSYGIYPLLRLLDLQSFNKEGCHAQGASDFFFLG
jgi:hypothetical protein